MISVRNEEDFEECTKQSYEDDGFCKYLGGEENENKAFKDRPGQTVEGCKANNKCRYDGRGKEYNCAKDSDNNPTNCQLRSVKHAETFCFSLASGPRCKANPKCDYIDEEDYDLLQLKAHNNLHHHLQAVSDVPHVALMPPMQLLEYFGERSKKPSYLVGSAKNESLVGTPQEQLKMLAEAQDWVKQGKLEDDEFDDEMAAAQLPHLIPDWRAACALSKKIVRKSGLKRFRELTGLKRSLKCKMSLAQRSGPDLIPNPIP